MGGECIGRDGTCIRTHPSCTWEDLEIFKREVWNPSVQDHEARSWIQHCFFGEGDAVYGDLKALLDPRADVRTEFFDFDRAATESIVSFFLELLLAHTEPGALFRFDDCGPRPPGGEDEKEPDIRFFQMKTQGATTVGAYANTLSLLYNLLSLHQRRELSRGSSSTNPHEARSVTSSVSGDREASEQQGVETWRIVIDT